SVGPGIGHVSLTFRNSAFHHIRWNQGVAAVISHSWWIRKDDIIVTGHYISGRCDGSESFILNGHGVNISLGVALTSSVGPGIGDVSLTFRNSAFHHIRWNQGVAAVISHSWWIRKDDIIVTGHYISGRCDGSESFILNGHGVNISLGVALTISVGPGIGHVSLTFRNSAFHHIRWNQGVAAVISQSRRSRRDNTSVTGHSNSGSCDGSESFI